jgi:hypothetical protein
MRSKITPETIIFVGGLLFGACISAGFCLGWVTVEMAGAR